jgi:ubiquitin C-terminal hydrolase
MRQHADYSIDYLRETITFDEFLDANLHYIETNRLCLRCQQQRQRDKRLEFRGTGHQYFMIDIQRFMFRGTNNWDQVPIRITGFNPDAVDIQGKRWRLRTALQHQSGGVYGGHWICWWRCPTGGWTVIDDKRISHRHQLIPNIHDYTLLLLEECDIQEAIVPMQAAQVEAQPQGRNKGTALIICAR